MEICSTGLTLLVELMYQFIEFATNILVLLLLLDKPQLISPLNAIPFRLEILNYLLFFFILIFRQIFKLSEFILILLKLFT